MPMSDYLNIKKMIKDKKEYKAMMDRVHTLPEEYQFVYEKMTKYMWSFAGGSGYDMLRLQYDLIELFEEGAAEGKSVLEITGDDVAAFCDELLKNAKTYTEGWREKLNRDIHNKLEKRDERK